MQNTKKWNFPFSGTVYMVEKKKGRKMLEWRLGLTCHVSTHVLLNMLNWEYEVSLIRMDVCCIWKHWRNALQSVHCFLPSFAFALYNYDCVSLWTYYFFQTVSGTSPTQATKVIPLSVPRLCTPHHCVSHKFIHNLQLFIFCHLETRNKRGIKLGLYSHSQKIKTPLCLFSGCIIETTPMTI